MREEKGPRYTCTEYREEMRLLALKRKLEQPDLNSGMFLRDMNKVLATRMSRHDCERYL